MSLQNFTPVLNLCHYMLFDLDAAEGSRVKFLKLLQTQFEPT